MSVPAGTRFIGILPGVNMTERKSTQANSPTEVYTIDEINQDLQSVTDEGNTTSNDIQFDAGVGILLDNGSRLREGTIDAGTGGTKGIAQIC